MVMCLPSGGSGKKSFTNNLLADETRKRKSKLHHCSYFFNKLQENQTSLLPTLTLYKKLGFTLRKAEQPLRGMELQKKKKKKRERKPKTRREIL